MILTAPKVRQIWTDVQTISQPFGELQLGVNAAEKAVGFAVVNFAFDTVQRGENQSIAARLVNDGVCNWVVRNRYRQLENGIAVNIRSPCLIDDIGVCRRADFEPIVDAPIQSKSRAEALVALSLLNTLLVEVAKRERNAHFIRTACDADLVVLLASCLGHKVSPIGISDFRRIVHKYAVAERELRVEGLIRCHAGFFFGSRGAFLRDTRCFVNPSVRLRDRFPHVQVSIEIGIIHFRIRKRRVVRRCRVAAFAFPT